MASPPYSVMMPFQRRVISPMASSQLTGSNSPCPFFPVRLRGGGEAQGRIDRFLVMSRFGTERAARERMLGIAGAPDGPAVFPGDKKAAAVRTVVRATGSDYIHKNPLMGQALPAGLCFLCDEDHKEDISPGGREVPSRYPRRLRLSAPSRPARRSREGESREIPVMAGGRTVARCSPFHLP